MEVEAETGVGLLPPTCDDGDDEHDMVSMRSGSAGRADVVVFCRGGGRRLWGVTGGGGGGGSDEPPIISECCVSPSTSSVLPVTPPDLARAVGMYRKGP